MGSAAQSRVAQLVGADIPPEHCEPGQVGRPVREIAREGRDVSALVPAPVARRLKERFAR